MTQGPNADTFVPAVAFVSLLQLTFMVPDFEPALALTLEGPRSQRREADDHSPAAEPALKLCRVAWQKAIVVEIEIGHVRGAPGLAVLSSTGKMRDEGTTLAARTDSE